MKRVICALVGSLILVSAIGCGGGDKVEMPKDIPPAPTHGPKMPAKQGG